MEKNYGVIPYAVSFTHEGRVGNCARCGTLVGEAISPNKCQSCGQGLKWDEDGLFLRTNEHGKLFILDVFSFYEEPLLFTCNTPNGDLYLLSCLAPSEENIHEYMIVPVTKERIEDMKAQRVDIRTMFTEKERKARLLTDRHKGKFAQVKAIFMEEEDLPDKDVYLTV